MQSLQIDYCKGDFYENCRCGSNWACGGKFVRHPCTKFAKCNLATVRKQVGGQACVLRSKVAHSYVNGKHTAKFAGRFNIRYTTSLTVSPYKSSQTIFEIGRELGNFAEYNFKKENGYLKSTQIARELGFYRQNFCGCLMSKKKED